MGSESSHDVYRRHQDKLAALQQTTIELEALTERWRVERQDVIDSCEEMNRVFLDEVPSPHLPDALKQGVSTPVVVPTTAEPPVVGTTEPPTNNKRPRAPAGSVKANVLRLVSLGPISAKRLVELTQALGAPKIARRLAQNGYLQQEPKTRFFILTKQGQALLESDKTKRILAQIL